MVELDVLADEDLSGNLFNEYDEPSDSDDPSDDNDNSSEPVPSANFGLKSKCVFNRLESFHAVTSMPPDSMHDLMEGKRLNLV